MRDRDVDAWFKPPELWQPDPTSWIELVLGYGWWSQTEIQETVGPEVEMYSSWHSTPQRFP